MSGEERPGRGGRTTLTGDDRAVTPAVGKSLEATVVILFIGLLTATLFGNVVPGYRTAAGDEVADRTLAGATHRISDAVPSTGGDVTVRHRVSLPATIRGEGYRIRVDGRDLVLIHPDRGVDDRARLSLPDAVVTVTGEWYSRRDPVVVVETAPGGLAVRLEHADPGASRLSGGWDGDRRQIRRTTGDESRRRTPTNRAGGRR